eukprot:5440593-Prymnesium_polylepis.1
MAWGQPCQHDKKSPHRRHIPASHHAAPTSVPHLPKPELLRICAPHPIDPKRALCLLSRLIDVVIAATRGEPRWAQRVDHRIPIQDLPRLAPQGVRSGLLQRPLLGCPHILQRPSEPCGLGAAPPQLHARLLDILHVRLPRLLHDALVLLPRLGKDPLVRLLRRRHPLRYLHLGRVRARLHALHLLRVLLLHVRHLVAVPCLSAHTTGGDALALLH